MTTERPEQDALCWFTNGADRTVDVHVNYRAEAYVTLDPQGDRPAFSVDSDADGLFGTYTFEARATDDSDGEVLASASVEFEAGAVHTAVFHPVGEGEYRFSVYETDFSPSAASRFEIHHVGFPEQVDWRLAPKPEADPSIQVDERSGTLECGQWQRAVDVTANEYRLEVLVDGEVVAFRPDLELEGELLTACYVVGDPGPEMGPDAKQAHVFRDRYQIPAGEKRRDETTAPAEPRSTADDNRSVEFDADPPELFETDGHETAVEATDPDGIVAGLAVDAVEPATDGFRILEDGVTHPAEIGESMTATLAVSSSVPAGSYDVRLVANPEGLGERATATVPVEVKPMTADRLWAVVEGHHGGGRVTDDVAKELFGLLRDAGASPDEGALDELVDDVFDLFGADDGSAADSAKDRRKALDEVATLVSERQGDGIDEVAADDVETKTEALLERLGSA